MKLKIRTKVLLGILFVFVEFVIIGSLSMYYISTLKYGSELLIKNNYRSVQYAENMIQSLDETNTAVNSLFLNKHYQYDKELVAGSFDKFEKNLQLEGQNITELGEKELVQSIKEKYARYKSLVLEQNIKSIPDKVNFYTFNILPLTNELKAQIFSVSTLNMHSIVQKNEKLSEMVSQIYKNLSILLTFCLLITASFLFNFPNYIAGPIKRITENIKEMVNNNFSSRIRISTNDEFKELSEAINDMAEKLETNYKHVELQPAVTSVPEIDENEILQNIQGLLESIRPVIESISKNSGNKTLLQQSELLKEIEYELSKAIKP
ncbi:MAG: HAMP domain-containing protein [Paludibacter sp.]|nr:HAMP domain-containing protein [Paludibacter sp.]